MRHFYYIFFIVSVFAVMADPGCAQTRRIVFSPQWTPQSQFAGYYVAQAKGFYKEVGLDIVIDHPSASNPALNRLREGSSHVITLQLVQAIKYIDQGIPLVNILQTSQQSSLMIVPRRKDIRTLQDLNGKKVGIWKAGFGEPAQILANRQKLDIRWIPFVSNVNLFISGAIDATLATSYNEYLQILACGIQPEHVFYLADLGYDIPEDGLYVTADYYDTHRCELQAFAEASRRGWEWAAAHPEEALTIVMEEVRRHHVGTNKVHQKRMLDNILHLQHRRNGSSPAFGLSPEDVEKASGLLLDAGLIRHKVTYRQITGQP